MKQFSFAPDFDINNETSQTWCEVITSNRAAAAPKNIETIHSHRISCVTRINQKKMQNREIKSKVNWPSQITHNTSEQWDQFKLIDWIICALTNSICEIEIRLGDAAFVTVPQKPHDNVNDVHAIFTVNLCQQNERSVAVSQIRRMVMRRSGQF